MGERPNLVYSPGPGLDLGPDLGPDLYLTWDLDLSLIISQLPIDQIEKVQCSTEREFHELFKTNQHLTFISGFILVW